MKNMILGAFVMGALLLSANGALAGEVGKYHRDFGDRGGAMGGVGVIQGHEIMHELGIWKDGEAEPGPRGWGRGWGHRRPVEEGRFILHGKIDSVNDSQLVISDADADWRHPRPMQMYLPETPEFPATIKLNSDTVVHVAGQEAKLSDLKAGMRVMVTGTRDGEVLTAERVHVIPEVDVVRGEVTAVDGDKITIKDPRTDESRTITVDSDDQIRINGQDSEVEDIDKGDRAVVRIKSVLGEVWQKVVRVFRR